MSDLAVMHLWRLELDGNGVGVVEDSFTVHGDDARLEEIVVASQEKPSLMQMINKRPAFTFQLYDLDLVKTFLEIGAAKDVSSVRAIFRAKELNGGWGATVKSVNMPQGVIFPTSLNSPVQGPAIVDVTCLATYDTGTALEIGTDGAATAEVIQSIFYQTKTLDIGSDTALAYLKSLGVTWNWGIIDDDQSEPAYYYYDTARISGTGVLKDLDKVTLARLEDHSVEDVNMVFEDANGGGSDVTIDFGTRTDVYAKITGNDANFTFEALAS